MHKYPELRYIKQGDVLVAEEPVIFRTTLGSCVSVCLWDPYKQLGGINHYTRPQCSRDDFPQNMSGEHAIKNLIEGLLSRGSMKSQLRAGVFGGCHTLNFKANGLKIGQGNIEIAYEMLDAHGIQVIKSDTGHTHGLKLFFNTIDGTMKTEKVRSITVAGRKHNVPTDYLENVEKFRANFIKAFKEFNIDNT